MAKLKVLENSEIKIGKDVRHETALPQKGVVSKSWFTDTVYTYSGVAPQAWTTSTIYIDVSRNNASLAFMGSAVMKTSATTSRLYIMFDGVAITGFSGITNRTSYETVNVVAHLDNVSKGRHKVELGWSTQNASTTVSVDQYATKTLIAWEV